MLLNRTRPYNVKYFDKIIFFMYRTRQRWLLNQNHSMNKMTQKDDDLHSIDKEKENERLVKGEGGGGGGGGEKKGEG